MPSIGGVGCFRVSGQKSKPAQRLDVWQIPGIDGVGVQQLGPGLGRSTFRVINFGTSATLQTWLDSIRDVVGTAVTIINDHNQSFTNMIILEVTEPDRQTANDQLAGTTMRWEIQVIAVAG